MNGPGRPGGTLLTRAVLMQISLPEAGGSAAYCGTVKEEDAISLSFVTECENVLREFHHFLCSAGSDILRREDIERQECLTGNAADAAIYRGNHLADQFAGDRGGGC